jgi:hypothetical protein
MINFLKALLKDLIDQAWTLLGMAVAWLVLEGSAKQLTGQLIMFTLGVWIVTFPMRYEKPIDMKPKKKLTPRKKSDKK